jgi:hypothetical protein
VKGEGVSNNCEKPHTSFSAGRRSNHVEPKSLNFATCESPLLNQYSLSMNADDVGVGEQRMNAWPKLAPHPS